MTDVRGLLEEKHTTNGARARSFARALMFGVFAFVAALYLVAFIEQATWGRGLPEVSDTLLAAVPDALDKAMGWEEARFERTRRLLDDLVQLALYSVFPYAAKALGFAIPKRNGGTV